MKLFNIKTEIELPVGAYFVLDSGSNVYQVVECESTNHRCANCFLCNEGQACLFFPLICTERSDGKEVYFARAEADRGEDLEWIRD